MVNNQIPKLYANADIGTRWGKNKQAMHNFIVRNKDFPKPVMHVQNGRIALYLESDIIEYEKLKGIEPVI